MARELKEGYDRFPPASVAWRRPYFRRIIGWRRWVGRGLLIWARQRQAAAVNLGCRRRRLSDPAEPAASGADSEREGPGCQRRFLSRVHGDNMHLSSDV